MKMAKLIPALSFFLFGAAAGLSHWQQPGPKPAIDPEAETIWRQLSEHNKQVKTGIFRLADTIDGAPADGRKLQFAHVRVMTVSGPIDSRSGPPAT